VEDVVDAYELVLNSDAANYRPFNVGSGRAMSVLEYADVVSKRLGKEVSVEVSGEYRRGDNRHSVSSISELRKLGWAPRRTIPDILNDFVSWVDASGGIPADSMNAHAHMKQVGVVVEV
jgi:dTDP-L-rhamnose 4-epimerase